MSSSFREIQPRLRRRESSQITLPRHFFASKAVYFLRGWKGGLVRWELRTAHPLQGPRTLTIDGTKYVTAIRCLTTQPSNRAS